MDYNTIFKLTLGGIILLAVGSSLGYFYAPDKIKTVEKIVEVEKKVTEENHKTTKEYDPTTGKITKEVDESGTKTTDTSTTKTDKETEKTKTQKQYAIKGGVVHSLNKADALTYRVGVEMAIPLFGMSLGAEGDIDVNSPKAGIYARLPF